MSFLHRLFKFRIFKFRTTLAEELEDLHTETGHLQQTLEQKRLLQQKWTKRFAFYTLLAYFVLNLVFYTFFRPEDYLIHMYTAMISITLGALLYGIHRLICWYFRTIIQMKEDRINLFNDRKQELIEQVKNKETYAVAKGLLEKYGETITPDVYRPAATDNQNRDLRQRLSNKSRPLNSHKSKAPVSPSNIGQLETINQQPQTPAHDRPNHLPIGTTTSGKLPQPILPSQRTFMGIILDMIVGDGPSKRYALICKSCNSHNGMALQEEFEYISFRCAYCNYFNSARQQKPIFRGDIAAHDPGSTVNNLQTTHVEPLSISSSDTSDSFQDNESKDPASSTIISRSIHASDDNMNESQSRSTCVENGRHVDATVSSSGNNRSSTD